MEAWTCPKRRLRELEGKNARLKKLLAQAHLDVYALKRSTSTILSAVYVVDVCHLLNNMGEIGPDRGPGRKMADVVNAVIAHY